MSAVKSLFAFNPTHPILFLEFSLNMEYVSMQTIHVPILGPLAIQVASSFIGFVSLFVCYKALVKKEWVRANRY
jgi:hypothetical protein